MLFRSELDELALSLAPQARNGMPKQDVLLELPRCPYCNIDLPNLSRVWSHETKNSRSLNLRHWNAHACRSCGGVVLTASTQGTGGEIVEIYPSPRLVADEIPDRARAYLTQAIASAQASAAGAVIVASIAVDWMLKAKGLVDGTLYQRIDRAAETHVITAEMAAWAHEVRLDANAQRHADESIGIPTEEDARRVIEFARALADYLFVLPARVKKGRERRGE